MSQSSPLFLLKGVFLFCCSIPTEKCQAEGREFFGNTEEEIDEAFIEAQSHQPIEKCNCGETKHLSDKKIIKLAR